jgi:hypothetical protein
MLREADLHLPKNGWGEDRPGRVGVPGGHGLDRPAGLGGSPLAVVIRAGHWLPW